MKKFLADIEEEAQADQRRRRRRAPCDAAAYVLDAISQCVRKLDIERRAGLLHVVARDRDRVKPRHVAAPCIRMMSATIRIDGSGG